MYLDTDVIVALVKKNDWLKPMVEIEKIKDPKTSVLTLVEGELVLDREYRRKYATQLTKKIRSLGIDMLPVTQAVIERSSSLLACHGSIGVFDSVHAAICLLQNCEILSTDHIYDRIPGVKRIDPRSL